MRGSLFIISVLALGTSTGCAAVFKGGKQDVTFEGIPQGSDVKIDGAFAGATPTTAEIDRDRPPNIVVSKPGYKEQYVRLVKKADTPWFFWDIATCVIPITLCIPVLVDGISGAWYSYEDVYRVKLDPLAGAPVVLTPSQPSAPPPPPSPPKDEYGL